MMYIAEATRKPHLFLSHSSSDKIFVRKLAKDLLACEVDVWLDEWEITPGDSIYQEISNGIESSKYVALIISKAFLDSKWVSEEVESAFLKQMREKNKVILPLLLEEVQLPPLLESKLYLSFIENYYISLARLVGLIHNINPKTISEAIVDIDPNSLNKVIELLKYCGVDPYMIISKEIFDELANTGLTEVKNNRLSVLDVHKLMQMPLSKSTHKFLERL